MRINAYRYDVIFKMSIKCKVSSTVWYDLAYFRVKGYNYTKSHIQADSMIIISNSPFYLILENSSLWDHSPFVFFFSFLSPVLSFFSLLAYFYSLILVFHSPPVFQTLAILFPKFPWQGGWFFEEINPATLRY